LGDAERDTKRRTTIMLEFRRRALDGIEKRALLCEIEGTRMIEQGSSAIVDILGG